MRRLCFLLCVAALAISLADNSDNAQAAQQAQVEVEMRQATDGAGQHPAADERKEDHAPAVPVPEPEPTPMPPPAGDIAESEGSNSSDSADDADEPAGVVLLRRQNPRRAHLAAPLNPYEEAEPWAAAKHAEEEAAERNPVPEALPAPPRKGKGKSKGKGKAAGAGDASGAGAAAAVAEDDGGASAFDDYYGLTTEPAYHLDTAAFQPSHTLEFVLAAGETLTLYEDVAAVDVGRVIRGDWFVTTGEELSARVVVTAPDGTMPYAAGPANDDWDGVDPARALLSEGSFHFIAARAGTYRVDVINPSESVERGVAFAWLLGKDNDDPFVQPGERGAPPKAGVASDAEQGKHSSGSPDGASTVVAGSAAATVAALKRHASLLHKRIDDLVSMMAYADVRFKRHLATVESTNARVLKYTLLETGIIAASVALSLWFVHRLKFRNSGARPAGFAGV